jgi:hypothetical protein
VIVRRRYAPHRRAYWPSPWPTALPAGLLAGVLAWLVQARSVLGALGIALAAAVLGAVVMQVRIAIWRRRHPVISAQEYAHDLIESQRRAAPWN